MESLVFRKGNSYYAATILMAYVQFRYTKENEHHEQTGDNANCEERSVFFMTMSIKLYYI